MNEMSSCFISSSAFGVVWLLDFGHSNWCVVVFAYFNLHFHDGTWCDICFNILNCHLCIFFVDMSVKIFGLFFNCVVFFFLSCKSSFYILDSSSLSDVSFTNVFIQSMTFLFILLTLSFIKQKFFIIKFRLPRISSIDCAFIVISKKYHHHTQYHHQLQGFLHVIV